MKPTEFLIIGGGIIGITIARELKRRFPDQSVTGRNPARESVRVCFINARSNVRSFSGGCGERTSGPPWKPFSEATPEIPSAEQQVSSLAWSLDHEGKILPLKHVALSAYAPRFNAKVVSCDRPFHQFASLRGHEELSHPRRFTTETRSRKIQPFFRNYSMVQILNLE